MRKKKGRKIIKKKEIKMNAMNRVTFKERALENVLGEMEVRVTRVVATLVPIVLVAMIMAGASLANAVTIVSQVGQEAVGGVGIDNTLSGDFSTAVSLSWTHSYTPITGTILSATLRVDLLDADNGYLKLFAGTDASGTLIGIATGADQATPEDGATGPWRDLQSPPPEGSFDNLIDIDPLHFTDLADGTFQVFGENNSLASWASNRALLTIEVVPEPGSLLLLGSGLVGVIGFRSYQKR